MTSLSTICSQHKFCAMQMRERKYIRFDFTQALHTRATGVERRDYRIIARTRASDHLSTRALAHAVRFVATAHGFAREAPAQQPTQLCSIPDFPIYCAPLRDSWLLMQKHFIALSEQALRPCAGARTKSIHRDERIKSKRRACASQSNFSWWIASRFLSLSIAISDFSTRLTPRIR